ncbi:ABC transporter permease [Paenibacillus jiagnxiensis]|uniref:ABC transporter permease n=1 Tax=Paenibacillus jiagnxiensis TaxID=3228926 RepID=UPI0033B7902D
MNYFIAALRVEIYKLRRSLVPWLTLLFVMAVVSQEVGQPDWHSYLSGAVYRFTILGSIGFGFLTSWLFGREYADRTLKDLLALPVSRLNIVLAKYAAVLVSCVLISVVLFVYVLGLGMIVGLPGFSADMIWQAFGVFGLTTVFNMLLCTLVAFIACWSRGWLAPIGFVFLTLVLALSLGPGPAGPYVPWAIPALQTLHFSSGGTAAEILNMMSYIILGVTGAAGFVGTLAWWRYSDQR